MASGQLLDRGNKPMPWAHTAKKCKSGVLDLIHKVSKFEEQSSLFKSAEYTSSGPTRSIYRIHEKYAESLNREKRLKILLVWRSYAKSKKQSRQASKSLHSLRQQFRLRMLFLKWHSVAVKQPKMMMGAYKRLQRRGHHSLSVISAQYGAYAHYWLRVLLLSWKRLVFDAPGGFLLHRETRLRRQQNFGNALFTSTKLLSRAYEVHDKETQCTLRSREETVYDKKIQELDAEREQGKMEEVERVNRENELRSQLDRLKSDYEAMQEEMQRALELEKQNLAEAQKQIQRQQRLLSVKSFATGDMESLTSELKGMREQALTFPMMYDCPVVATINNIHQIELRNLDNTQKLLQPISHRISSCKLCGETLLVYENDNVLISFDSENPANLFVVVGVLTEHIQRNRTDSTGATIYLNVYHQQSRHAQSQVEEKPLDEIKAANHKVELLLSDHAEEKKTIEDLMKENSQAERPAMISARQPLVELEEKPKLSLDQQLRKKEAKEKPKLSLDQQLRKKEAKEKPKLSLDQQLREAEQRKESESRPSKDDAENSPASFHQKLMLSTGSRSKSKPNADEGALFSRLSMSHRPSEANLGLIEEL
ncbi:hypothetical protein HOP50_04g28130 [Chloropicon primus]|uniref:Uncharacterized protein n=1 Tax=Chloropicon primus TaxID=1764295 RepID=A0A5B8MKR7_9CHLO|nr:hypothetical protein A3770_04p28130 [Chloropicon primus]UPQ99505.1 hypothetical protein HOP50_04g28130 [Chloropicon primus]|eukprot:QDZ20295.1 hypothetical protein A3770_04p28130 [Chloropicon primus]